MTVKTAFAVVEPSLARIVAGVGADTRDVLIVNSPVCPPAGMKSDAGTDAVELLEDNTTTTPY